MTILAMAMFAMHTMVATALLFLSRSHWGGRYNGEMKRLMLRHAFRFVSCVVFLVGPQNSRSQRAVERIGGVRVGTRPDTGGRDSYLYQITASTFGPQDG